MTHRAHATFAIALAVLFLAVGCEATMARRRSGLHAARGDAGADDAGLLPIGMNIPSREACGNGLDDDDDGMIDEGCSCEAGTSRPCYGGPPDTRGVGVCHDGVQGCDAHGEFPEWGTCDGEARPGREIVENGLDDDCDGTTDEPDGICIPTGDVGEVAAACHDGRDNDCDTLRDCDDPDCAREAGCTSSCEARETRCFGGLDDDCDGATDCADSDCASDTACMPSVCPPGQTPTYHRRDRGSFVGSSGISEGDGGPVMTVTCDPGRCEAGLVAVEESSSEFEHFPAGGTSTFTCVPPPPPCPEGLNPNYRGSGMWRCDPPCELLVHYGGIYGFLTVCAERPHLTCESGQVPTFVYETEAWECRPECDNGLYDRIYVDGGAFLCVPC